MFYFCPPSSFDHFEALRVMVRIWLTPRKAQPHVSHTVSLECEKAKENALGLCVLYLASEFFTLSKSPCISPTKWIYLGITWELHASEKQKKRTLFYELGRRCCKQRVHWRKLKFWSRVTSLAELLQPPSDWAITEQGEIFSSSCWGSSVTSYFEMKYFSFCWGQ